MHKLIKNTLIVLLRLMTPSNCREDWCSSEMSGITLTPHFGYFRCKSVQWHEIMQCVLG